MSFIPIIEPQRLIRLGTDLEALRAAVLAGEMPDDHAPLIEAWRLADGGWKCLLGQVTGHPLLGTTTVVTTPIVAIDGQLRWARTVNTLYRLGQRA